MLSFNPDKAPGLGGFNAHFFRSVGESSNMMCAKLYRTSFEVESC